MATDIPGQEDSPPEWTPPKSFADATTRTREYVRIHHAHWPQIRTWGYISLLIASAMIIGTGMVATFQSTPDSSAGAFNLLLGSHTKWQDFWYLVVRNHLVLGIHFGACLIGAIIGRRHYQVAGAYNPELPVWVAKAALWYAWIVTLSSVIVQTTRAGWGLGDFAAYTHIHPLLLMLLLLPHALLELAAIFLPLALFMREARIGRLQFMGLWSVQSVLIASPIITIAALVEVFITPHIVAIFIS